MRALALLLSSDASAHGLNAADLGAVASAADAVGLAPALWAHGCQSHWWRAVPADAVRLIQDRSNGDFAQPELALQEAFETNGARNRDLLQQGETIEAAFAASGIDSVRLKGWHTMATGWWPDIAARTTTDLDVLVPGAQIDQARDVLDDLGYSPIESGHTDEADHELPPVHLAGRSGSVEIHRALAVSRWAAVLPTKDVLSGARPMSTSDAVCHLIVHAQLHDESHLLGTVPWRALYEFSVLLAGPTANSVDWELVRRRFASNDAEAAFDGFLWLATTAFGTNVGPRAHSLHVRSRLAWALVDRPTLGSFYARAAYLPRAMSAARMRAIDPDASAWLTRLRRIGSHLRRS